MRITVTVLPPIGQESRQGLKAWRLSLVTERALASARIVKDGKPSHGAL
jgi:hypothetical protein